MYVDECLKFESTIISTRRMRRILDARYGKSNLKKFMTEQCQHLNPSELESFINLLKVEYFFNGTLGTWNTAPVGLELKDDVKPVCSRSYPVPRVYEPMFRN